jgi:hypothetical protein
MARKPTARPQLYLRPRPPPPQAAVAQPPRRDRTAQRRQAAPATPDREAKRQRQHAQRLRSPLDAPAASDPANRSCPLAPYPIILQRTFGACASATTGGKAPESGAKALSPNAGTGFTPLRSFAWSIPGGAPAGCRASRSAAGWWKRPVGGRSAGSSGPGNSGVRLGTKPCCA